MKLAFETTIDSSRYCADFPQAGGVDLLGIDYESGVYRFRLTNGSDESAQVFGVNSEAACETNAASDIAAAVVKTQPVPEPFETSTPSLPV